MLETTERAGFGGWASGWSGVLPAVPQGWSARRQRTAHRAQAASELRGWDLVVWVGLGLAVLLPIALIAVVVGPYRPVAVNTESMQPTLAPGDVTVSEVVSASAVREGDIISYQDSMRYGAVIIERVVGITPREGGYAFTTAGDASSEVTEWTIDRESKLGRVAFVAPGLAHWLALPSGLAGGALLVALLVLALWLVVRPRHRANRRFRLHAP